jgi:uncharacterized Zn finger protein
MTQDLDKQQLIDGRNPFVCAACGTVAEVLKVRETGGNLSLVLRCRECRATFTAAFSSKTRDPKVGIMSSI